MKKVQSSGRSRLIQVGKPKAKAAAKKASTAPTKKVVPPAATVAETVPTDLAPIDDQHRYALTLSLNVLEHLGIGLYSNAPAVLSEIVANAWDADASSVQITLDRKGPVFTIQDDGAGMTTAEVNERFLKVGHRRRDVQPGSTPKGRQPMGRKGIGKLSLFSIANVVKVETVRDGQPSAFLMRLKDIKAKVRDGGEATYFPEELDASSIDFAHGTRITLTELRRNPTVATDKALRKRIARRFTILTNPDEFSISVNGTAITSADRAYYDKLQYAWAYGDQSNAAELAINADETEARPAPAGLQGWLGTVRESGQLKDEDGDNLNRIAIFVRGKLAQEDMLGDFSERGVFASYLIGELRFDGFDLYDGLETAEDDDAATSSRQHLVEDDPRYDALKNFIQGELKHIQNRWSDLRSRDGARTAQEIPEIREWMDGLKAPIRKKAEKWIGKLNRIRLDTPQDQRRLMKHAILGFEFYRLHENLDALVNISDESLPDVLDLFKEFDGLEMSLYGQIVQQRVSVIATLRQKVAQNSLEKAIQGFLFNHLWLLDPSWERAEGTEVMEKSVGTMFKAVDASLTLDEKKGRLDIAYRKAAGGHIIVELKRPERVVTLAEMVEQSQKYISGMEKILTTQGTPHEPIDVVFVLGKLPQSWDDQGSRTRGKDMLAQSRTRVVYFNELLVNAERTYRDYLEHKKTADTLGRIMKAIDDYAPETV